MTQQPTYAELYASALQLHNVVDALKADLASVKSDYVGMCAVVKERDAGLARLIAELDRYKRLSESGESLGGELEERERRMEVEAENKALRKKVEGKQMLIDWLMLELLR